MPDSIRIHRFVEVHDETREVSRQLGGAIVGLEGEEAKYPSNEVEVRPDDDTGETVRLTVWGSTVYMDINATNELIKLLEVARDAVISNSVKIE